MIEPESVEIRVMVEPKSVQIRGEPDIVTARQMVRHMAKDIGFSMTDQIKIATGVSELTRNIVRYTEGGRVDVKEIIRNERRGIEIVCVDKGQGISDVELAMKDGYTTSGGLGEGLPGTKRLMDEFEIESTVGVGTKVVCRKWL
jgi:serine/threonine-protein kinase RsbT